MFEFDEFDERTTAEDVVRGLNLEGMRVVVTGGSSGLGFETARVLAGAGADVTVTVRNLERARPTIDELRRVTPTGTIRVEALDLSDLTAVDRFVRIWDGPLDVLINNAGVMALQTLTRTRTGLEMQFATNHLGHHALANGLHDALVDAGQARIVAVSSSGHLMSPVVFDDVNFNFRDYTPFGAYGQSKSANVLFAVEAQRRWARDGITANALHPGGVATSLQRHVGGSGYMAEAEERFRRAGTSLKSIGQGAATTVFLAASPSVKGMGGRYFEDCAPAGIVEARPEGATGGVASYALDPQNASRLWALSDHLVSVTPG